MTRTPSSADFQVGLVDILVALPALLLWRVMALLRPSAASALGAWLGGVLGPVHPKHDRVKTNLGFVLGNADKRTVARMARASWRNAGAVFGEFPHLARIYRERTEVVIDPAVEAFVSAGDPVFIIGGHLGNWELQTFALAEIFGPMTFVYTPEQNRAIAAAVQRFRAHPNSDYSIKYSAVQQMLKAASAGRSIALAADLRVDSGSMLEFFGVPTPTSIAPARIARRTGLPIVPIRSERLDGFRFRITLCAPIGIDESLDDREAATEATEAINRLLETWIGERPGQWLCTKRRWPKQSRADGTDRC